MPRRNLVSALAVGLLIGACAPAEEPAVDTEAIRQELTDRMAAYKEAVLSSDVDGSIEFWTPDARILEPGMDLSGNEVGEFMREFFGTSRVLSFDIEAYDQFVHGDVAYEVGEYDETIEVEGEQQTIQNYYFIRWERGTDGAWRFDRVVAGPREAPSGM